MLLVDTSKRELPTIDLELQRKTVPSGEATSSILAVIVLYNIASRDSVTVKSLAQAIGLDGTGSRLKVLLFDNSPLTGTAPGIFEQEIYFSAPRNPGLAAAYNYGLSLAQESGCDWLLTLDQDTLLPIDALQKINATIDVIGADSQIAAIVPQIAGAQRILSPYWFRGGFMPAWYPRRYSGTASEATYALNSGSVLRVSALKQIGGYDPRFWLDASDHAIFHALASYGKRVYVAGNIVVEHDLSVVNRDLPISAERYENILVAEAAFWDLYKGWLASWERSGRLMGRLFRHLRHWDLNLSKVTAKYLAMRLLRSRRYRLQVWKSGLADRLGDQTPHVLSRPKVSVCMASYNGERYIGEQIASVLPQLEPSDELIIVDDASSDCTRERILQFDDSRIKLIVHSKNRGVVATFEDAVRSATGDLLFLCDGDDIWACNKVEKTLRAFATNPEAKIVCSGIQLIDENGQPIAQSEAITIREFQSSFWANLIHNRFQGSAMAFRSTLLPQILPFPKPKLFLHDAWIGMCNTLAGGITIYLAEPLLYYRRHSDNVSRRLGFKSQLVKRLQLVSELLKHRFRSDRARTIED